MEILEAIKTRKSIRVFKDIKVKDEHIEQILDAVRRVPSYFNTQQTGIIYTTDKNIIKELAILCGNQKQVANAKAFFLIFTDFYRIASYLESENMQIIDDENHLRYIGAIDAGLTTATLNYAARAFGYDGTVIGGVLANPDKIKKLFNMPEHTYVNLGFTLGVSDDNTKTLKPRIAKDATMMRDSYNKDAQVNAIKDYEKELDEWFNSINVKQPLFGDIVGNTFAKK